MAIVYPLRAHAILSTRRVKRAIICIWVAAVLCSCPTAIFNRLTGKYCELKISDDPVVQRHGRLVYKYLEFTLFFVLPLLIQLVLYIKIAIALGSRQRQALSEEAQQPLDRSSRNSRSSARSERRSSRQAVIMLATCVVVFFISYLPIQVLLFYETFMSKPFHLTWVARAVVLILLYINSASNPVIYYTCNATYQKKFREMYGCVDGFKRKGTESSDRGSDRSGRRGMLTSSIRMNGLH